MRTVAVVLLVSLLTGCTHPGGTQKAASGRATFYISPAGDDSQRGTEAKPFATLARAQQAARQSRPAVVIVRAGVYYLPNPLVFTAADSDTEYRAAPGEEVVISGGARLNLTWEPYRDGIFRARTASGMEFDQLFVNGERQLMARYPNYDAKIRPYGGYAADAISKERAKRWAHPEGGFIHAMHAAHWGGYHYRITGKSEAGDLTYEGGWQNNRQMGMHSEHRFVENILEELDCPGEWFHDSRNQVLYFMPPAGVDLEQAVVEVTRLRHLVEFRGSEQQPVSKVSLQGFTFRHAARTFMDVREPLLRSDWTIYRGGALLFDGAEDCAISDCQFDQLGGNAVFVNKYNRRIRIGGCDIRDTGATAVAFVGDPQAVRNPLFEYNQRQPYASIDTTPGPKTANYPADCVVEDCLIRGVGLVEKQATGIQISMAEGITIRHCSIYNASRAGINIGDGCWGGHVVEFCDVFDTVLETGDHGSFNSWGRDRYWGLLQAPIHDLPKLALLDVYKPIVLRNNRWRCDHGWDVDLDDGSSNYEIYNNLFLHGGLKLREGFHRRVWNNIAVNNSLHPHVWYQNSGDIVTNNIWMGAYRPAAMPANLQKWGEEVDRNLFTSTEADRGAFAEKGCDVHSSVGAAMFLNPAVGDFRVSDGSLAAKMGFRNFPMDSFGVRKAELRAIAKQPEIPAVSVESGSVKGRPGETVQWRGATLRPLVGDEYSAYGVAKEAGGLALILVPPGSAAARDGLRVGDVLLKINGQHLGALTDFFKVLVNLHETAAPADLEIIRNQSPLLLRIPQPISDKPQEPK